MDDIKNLSLSKLEDLYKKKIAHWSEQRRALLEQAKACGQRMSEADQKLRHVQALIGGPQSAAAALFKPGLAKSGLAKPGLAKSRAVNGSKKKRRRKSPIREATLTVLRNRPGQKLSAAQMRTAIRKDTHRRCSRQSVHNNVNVLEEDGLVKRARAPRGTGAQFVFWAV